MKSVALLGVGRWGRNLLRILHQRNVLSKVWTRSLKAHTEHREAYPELCWTDKLSDIWEDSAIGAVVIATPAESHPALIEAALHADKDVFCEKPVAFSAHELRRLAELAHSRGKLLMGGHILHYHPGVEEIRRRLAAGELGKLLAVYSERTGMGRFPLSENALWGLAIHDLGLWVELLGTPIQAQATAQAAIQPTHPEAVEIHLTFPDSIQAHLRASWLHPERRRRLILIGTEGALVLADESSPPTLTYFPYKLEWHNGRTPHLNPAEGHPLPLPHIEPLAAEIDHFLACIATRTEPHTSAAALLPVTALAEKLARQLLPEADSPKPYYVHPTALIDEEVEIGEGTKIWHFSHILRGSRIGKNCVLGQNVVVGPFVRVGNNCKIQNNVSLYYGVELEDGVLCGPSCVFTNDKYPRAFIERRNEFLVTRVRQGATIGANATIMCGVTIGRFAMIGAGAVVTQDVPDHALVLGNPARQVGWVCTCGETLEKLPEEELYHCSRCDIFYRPTLKGLEKVEGSLLNPISGS